MENKSIADGLNEEYRGIYSKEKEARKMFKKFYGWKYFFKVSLSMIMDLAGDLYYKDKIPSDLDEYRTRIF